MAYDMMAKCSFERYSRNKSQNNVGVPTNFGQPLFSTKEASKMPPKRLPVASRLLPIARRQLRIDCASQLPR